MTLHKIDREKLEEALADICDKDGKPKYCNDYQDLCVVVQAAENWLAITDPGFDLPYPMQKAGALTRDLDALHVSSTQRAVATFKSMIAKAGE